MTTATPAANRAGTGPRLYTDIPASPGYALFTLPHVFINGVNMVTDERACVSIPIRAQLFDGYSGNYSIKMGNGVAGIMTITRGLSGSEAVQDYPGNDRMINNFPPGEFEASGKDYVELHIKPIVNWLEPGQRFHVFNIPIRYPRYMDNKTQSPPYHIPGILFGVQRPD